MKSSRNAFLIVVALSLCPCFAAANAADLKRIPLWKNDAPGTPATTPEHQPMVTLYRPQADMATQTAIIVCPGGGYGSLAMDHEGKQIGDWLSSLGVTTFVLEYRHRGTGHAHPVPMQDGQRAIRLVRSRASEFGIDPAKIGVLGFSAGGHLASTLGTHFDKGSPGAPDPVDRASSRPDFMILCYPVISMTAETMHRGSRDNLLGKDADEALARRMSNETQVTSDTPPTFIFQTDEDKAVPAENAVSFYLALRQAGVPAEMHIYQSGRHGVGLARDVPATSTWPERCREWMEARRLLAQ